MEKINELNSENLGQVSGGNDDGFIYYQYKGPSPEGQGINFDPSNVVENVLRCNKCGYVLNQNGPAYATANCPSCGAPLFGM